MKSIFTCVFALLFCSHGYAQHTVEAEPLDDQKYELLWDKFEHFELFEIPTDQVHQWVTSETEEEYLSLQLRDKVWDLVLYEHDMRSANYISGTEQNGEWKAQNVLPSITYIGNLRNNASSDVVMTITDDMIIGRVLDGDSEYIIENVKGIVEGAKTNHYIIYTPDAVLPTPGVKCGLDEVEHIHSLPEEDHHIHSHDGEGNEDDQAESGSMACYELIVALACDVGYTGRHGGIGGAQARMIGILNLVQTNYDNEFRDEIEFLLGPTFTATGSNPSSWNFSTNSSILATFRNWGNGGGFMSSTYDVATLWTVRTFGGVIGTAYLSALCGGNRYNFCVDFTQNADGLRDLQAHEMGHNFGFTHDPRGTSFIMTSGVFSSSIWSGQSKSQFNSRVPYSCMAPCFAGIPPIADFDANPRQGCIPQEVRFTDLSTNTPTSWRWSFPGAIPNTAAVQNPVVNYPAPGVYEVTLEATNNAGTGVERKTSFIEIGDVPIANFDENIILDEVIFVDRSIVYGASQYLWDFGDGNFSNDTDPTHVYEKDGLYLVTLTITTLCGTSTFQQTVEIVTPPEGDFTGSPLESCLGVFVDFLDESSENVDSWSWKFEGGSPQTSNLENPTVKYDTGGVFKVTLVVANSRYQNKVEKVGYITIDSQSVAGFSAAVDMLDVQFTDESEHAREYSWDFGDGNVSNQKDPMHTYAKDSTYTVTLITSNFCEDDTIEKMIQVGSLPEADFSADPQEACVTTVIDFTDESSANTTRRVWRFEGGSPTTSTEVNPSVEYDTEGEFKVTLVAINGLGGDTLVEEKYIRILDVPEGDFDFTRNGYEVDFNNLSLKGTSYAWDFGDGNTSMEENPNHTYPGDGMYEVVLITTNICGSDTVKKMVNLSNAPNANFTADETVGCVPMTVNFQNLSSTNSTEYEWRIPGGSPDVSTDVNPSVTFNNPGLYRVTLIAKNGFGADSVVKRDFIEVLDVPTSSYDYAQSGFTVEFMEMSEYGKTFEWDFGDGNTSNLANPTHVYADEGVYEVILKVLNPCGESSVSQMLTVTPRPILNFSLDKEEICKENTIQYTDGTENDPTSWLWTFEGGDPMMSTDQNPEVRYETSGTYDVILEATNSFGTTIDTFQQLVRVYDEPVSAYSYKDVGVRVNFSNESQEYGEMEWDFGDGNTSDEFEPSHLYSLPGTYEVELRVKNECGESVYSEEITVRHLDITFVRESIPPSPNPTTGWVQVIYSGTPSPGIEIYVGGVEGQLDRVYKGDFASGYMEEALDLSKYQSGTYMIFFKTDHEVHMEKVIVQD